MAHPPYGPPQGGPPQYPQGPPGGYPPQPPPGGYPPQGGYPQQGPPGYGGPGYAGPPKRSKTPVIIGGLLALLAVLGVGAFLLFPGDAEAGEVFLVPAASPGPDPFSTTSFGAPPNPNLAKPATASKERIAAPPNAQVRSNSGNQPGLYGGTRDKGSCNAAAMVSFLASNPQKAQAWVNALSADPAVQGLTTATIQQYVNTLTPLVLTVDTRVTNHGFKNNRANTIQSVLQKGTAVLVDPFGVPRVKCNCGNPLLPPVPSRSTVSYRGPRWPDFDPGNIVVVTPPPQPINVFVIVPPEGGDPFELPPGVTLTSVPPADIVEGNPAPSGNNVPPPPQQPRATAPPPPAPPAIDDCSDGSCLDDEEDFRAIDEAYERQQQEELAAAYAIEASRMGQENQNRGCGLPIGVDSEGHYQWALNQTPEAIGDALAQFNQMMANCTP